MPHNSYTYLVANTYLVGNTYLVVSAQEHSRELIFVRHHQHISYILDKSPLSYQMISRQSLMLVRYGGNLMTSAEIVEVIRRIVMSNTSFVLARLGSVFWEGRRI